MKFMSVIRSVILLSLLMCNGAVHGGVTIFGLEVGESTLAEVDSLYTINNVGVSSTDRVSIFELDVEQIDAEDTFGAECNFVSLRFNDHGILVALETSFKGSTYHRMQVEFDNRFDRDELTEQEALFFGQTATKYVRDGVEIIVLDVEAENQTRLFLK